MCPGPNRIENENNSISFCFCQVFNLYKTRNLIKYPSTLHVTVKSVYPPKNFAPSLRSFYAFQQEKSMNPNIDDNDGTMIKNELDPADDKLATLISNAEAKLTKKQFDKKSVIWSRLAGQPCRIPNNQILKLPSGKKGCYSIRFSKSGSYLACALVEENQLSPIAVYEIPDGKLYTKLNGHFGLVYDIDWSYDDKYIVSASNDATVRYVVLSVFICLFFFN